MIRTVRLFQHVLSNGDMLLPLAPHVTLCECTKLLTFVKFSNSLIFSVFDL